VNRLDLNLRRRESAPDAQLFREVRGQRLSGRVVIDNTSFEACAFQDAVLVYSGGGAPSMRDCSFRQVSFEFRGAAGRTMALLQAMSAASSGFRDIFKASFPKLFAH
jgi:hypothetical protein